MDAGIMHFSIFAQNVVTATYLEPRKFASLVPSHAGSNTKGLRSRGHDFLRLSVKVTKVNVEQGLALS